VLCVDFDPEDDDGMTAARVSQDYDDEADDADDAPKLLRSAWRTDDARQRKCAVPGHCQR